VSGNTAIEGAGIYNQGTVTVNSSAVSGNVAQSRGGGIYNDRGTVTLNSSTVTGNTAFQGGGIYNDGGTVTLVDSTVSGNIPDNCVGVPGC
jgi:hypothetical protein